MINLESYIMEFLDPEEKTFTFTWIGPELESVEEALEVSIKTWERRVELLEMGYLPNDYDSDSDSDLCALCQYYPTSMCTREMDIYPFEEKCPIARYTQETQCRMTPYRKYRTSLQEAWIDEALTAAREEVLFLHHIQKTERS